MNLWVMEQRYVAKRRSGRRWAVVAGVLWLVVGVLFFGFAGGGPNFGLLPVVLAALVVSGVALFQLSEARDANPARYGYR
jgi:hypothetical protein